MEEVVVDTACDGAWVNHNRGQIIQTEVDGSTPGNTGLAIMSKTAPSPVLIRSPTISPACGLRGSLKFGKKLQFTSPDKVGNAPKLDTVVDGKFPYDRDYASVSSQVIYRELSHGSRDDLCLLFRMNLLSNVVQTEAPQFVDLGLPAINTLNEIGFLGTPTTSI